MKRDFQFRGTDDVTSGKQPNPEGKPERNPTGKIHNFESGKRYQWWKSVTKM